MKAATSLNDSQHLSYNNQVIDISNPKHYQPLKNTEFHWYPPDMFGGRHQSHDENNNIRSNFNLTRAANKSCLVYARKIRDCVIGLELTD